MADLEGEFEPAGGKRKRAANGSSTSRPATSGARLLNATSTVRPKSNHQPAPECLVMAWCVCTGVCKQHLADKEVRTRLTFVTSELPPCSAPSLPAAGPLAAACASPARAASRPSRSPAAPAPCTCRGLSCPACSGRRTCCRCAWTPPCPPTAARCATREM